MSTAKISTTLDSSRVAEAKARVGERGFSKYLDEALDRMLQRDRLVALEQELVVQYGPINPEIQRALERVALA